MSVWINKWQLDFWWDIGNARQAASHISRRQPELLWDDIDVTIWDTVWSIMSSLEYSADFSDCPQCWKNWFKGNTCMECSFSLDFDSLEKLISLPSGLDDREDSFNEEEMPWKRKRAKYVSDMSSGLTYDINNFIIDIENGTFFLPFKKNSSSREKLAISWEFNVSFTEAFYASERKIIPNAHVKILKKYQWQNNGFYIDGRWYTVIRNYREDFNYKQLSKFLRSKIERSDIS